MLLVPGIGRQGGDEEKVARNAGDNVLINVSSGIDYADDPRAVAREYAGKFDDVRRKVSVPVTKKIEDEMASLIATLYLETEDAVEIRAEDPFTLTSGNRSLIYLNGRKALTDHRTRSRIVDHANAVVEEEILPGLELGGRKVKIAGGETAGISWGAWLADAMGTDYLYVRKNGKVEGNYSRDDTAILFEDLITDGKSNEKFVKSMRKVGLRVNDSVVVVDREQGGRQRIAGLKPHVELHSLVTLKNIVETGAEKGYLSRAEAGSVYEYLADPKKWHEERGFEWFD